MKKEESTRRNFIKSSLILGVAGAGGLGLLSSCSGDEKSSETMKVLLPDGNLVEVDKSSIKPIVHEAHSNRYMGDPNKKYVMVIDLAKCRNARACVTSCQKMHILPPQDEWMKVFLLKDGDGTSPYWFPKPCFQCNKPPCVNVCPVGATFKRLDGIVHVDNERCIGCKFCMTACPYSSRVFNWSEPEVPKEFKEGSEHCKSTTPHLVGTVGKCDFCPDHAENGELPACITACPNGVIYYGDRREDTVTNGTETLRFSQLIYEKAAYRYMEELGTNPSVYYLPPVNRLFTPSKGLINKSEEIKARYKDISTDV